MDLPKRIELIEVCPRDGFQNVHDIIPFEGKVAIIKKLAEAGFKRLEVVSFVSPKAIPQMADAKEVVAAVRDTLKAHGVRTVALVPNAQGVETRRGVRHQRTDLCHQCQPLSQHSQWSAGRGRNPWNSSRP